MAAIASRRDTVQVFDYVLFPESFLADVGITYVSASGETPNDGINEGLHVDAGYLEAEPIARLSTMVYTRSLDSTDPTEVKRCAPGKLGEWIAGDLDKGLLDETRVGQRILEKVANRRK